MVQFIHIFRRQGNCIILKNNFLSLYLQVLAKLPLLQQLGVRGCPLTAEGPNHPATLLEAFPLLETLDGKRVRARIRRRVGVPPGGTAAGAAAGAATAGGPAGARALGRQASVADNTGVPLCWLLSPRFSTNVCQCCQLVRDGSFACSLSRLSSILQILFSVARTHALLGMLIHMPP